MRRRLSTWIFGLMAIAIASIPAFADDKLKKEELDQLLAPIALYPDDLLINVLMASTYPLDAVQASRWVQEPTNKKLKGDALTKALEAKEWDPSIKALVQFPDVLKTMSDKLDWTQKLGDAFLAQQSEVMDEIQFLRAKADEAGHLKSNKQQKIVKEAGASANPVYIIEPATPQTVYVPVYQPTVVYGSWWYPNYPPFYWPRPGAAFVNGFFWAAGVAVAHDIWDWGHCDWHDHGIDIDVNKWNDINVNRNKIVNNKWEHRPDHRGHVPYRNKDVREKFKQADRGQVGNKVFRGHDRAEIRDRLKGTDHTRIDDKAVRDKSGNRPGAKIGNRGDNRPDAGKAIDRAKGGEARQKISRDIDRPRTRPSPGALDIKRGADVRRNADRGRASRISMAGRGNIGGGHRGGGRRR